jgi:hypothetical protein
MISKESGSRDHDNWQKRSMPRNDNYHSSRRDDAPVRRENDQTPRRDELRIQTRTSRDRQLPKQDNFKQRDDRQLRVERQAPPLKDRYQHEPVRDDKRRRQQ